MPTYLRRYLALFTKIAKKTRIGVLHTMEETIGKKFRKICETLILNLV
jgi:RNase P subunit RPR2